MNHYERSKMANNRLYLRCCNCGQTKFLAKHFSGPWSIRCKPEDIIEFMEWHYSCDNEFGFGDDDSWFNQFELVSEMGQGYPEIIEEKEIDSKYYTKVKRE